MKNPPSILLRVVLTILLSLAVSTVETEAQIRALNYDTPCYIEIEVEAVKVYEDAATVTLNFSRTGEFRMTTTVDYRTVDRTATAGEDYKAAGGTLVFKPGEGFKSITLEVFPDTDREGTEFFEVSLSSSEKYTVLPRDLVTIAVEDPMLGVSALPTLNISSPDAGAIRLSWSDESGLILERSTDPASVSSWQDFRCEVTSTNGVCEVVQPCDTTLYFYRLRRN